MRRWLSRMRRTLNIFFTGEDPESKAFIAQCSKLQLMRQAIAKKQEEEVLQGMRTYLHELRRLDQVLDEADKRSAAFAKEIFQVAKKHLLIRQDMEKAMDKDSFQGIRDSMRADRFEDVYFGDDNPKDEEAAAPEQKPQDEAPPTADDKVQQLR